MSPRRRHHTPSCPGGGRESTPDTPNIRRRASAQVELLREVIAQLPGAEGVEVASVDSFQGRENEVRVPPPLPSHSAVSRTRLLLCLTNR